VAVKLRLMRMGKKKQPTYRVVAADVRSPRDGRFIEIVGIYDPRREPSDIRIDNDKAVAWLSKGAQPTDTVRKLLKVSGAWEQYEGDRPAKTVKPARASKAAKPAKKAAKASKATKAAKAAKATKKAAKASS
jgi:small subunit ribosomal protein S16